MNTFEKSGILPELKKAVLELGFEKAMPVQQEVIPVILNSTDDVIALAQTGTGKTAAFGLPVLTLLDYNITDPQVLVLCPTRELCMQISKDIQAYGKYLKSLKICAVYGGASIEKQIATLKQNPQIIVATPGRINDIIRRKRVTLKNIKIVVLDEADEMLNMGFTEDLNTILSKTPATRRTLLFSATMPSEVGEIAKNYMKNTVNITIGKKNSGAENVSHLQCVINSKDRYKALKRIVDFFPDIYGIIFCRTRTETAEVAEKLMKDGYNADALHGDLSQSQRDYTMQRFRSKTLQILVATDVAARGLDVENISHVINYNLPDDNEVYTHRSGRTGRAGKSGISISLITIREKSRIFQIEKIINKKFEQMLIPSGKEICNKQILNIIQKLENIKTNDSDIDSFLPEIYNKLQYLSKEDIIKKFVSLEFNRFLEYYKNESDLNPYSDNRGSKKEKAVIKKADNYTVLRINIGSADGLNIRNLIGIINDCTNDRSIAIGKADIRPYFSLFGVDANFTKKVVAAVNNQIYNNRKIKIEKARESDQQLINNSSSRKSNSFKSRKKRFEK